jgi:ferredoxin
MIACTAYFGFFRKGCICAVGSVQNVSLALFDSSYAIPLGALVFFILPLAAAVLFGRVFCSGVCPLGALQDIVLLRPLRLPRFLGHALGFLPVVYLGLAVLFAATGAGFLICRYDPFVSVFRLDGSCPILLFGAGLLGLGTVLARPYCRFLCPYGVLLGWLSRASFLHAAISPDRCVECRLCDDSCPVDAIRGPSEGVPLGILSRRVRILGVLLGVLPLLVAGGGLAGSLVSPVLAQPHPEVSLAREVWQKETGAIRESTDAVNAFGATGRPREDLFQSAGAVQDRFRTGGWIVGGFMGLVLGLRLAALLGTGRRTEYEIQRGPCLSCARCFKGCPREQLRRRGGKGEGSHD